MRQPGHLRESRTPHGRMRAPRVTSRRAIRPSPGGDARDPGLGSPPSRPPPGAAACSHAGRAMWMPGGSPESCIGRTLVPVARDRAHRPLRPAHAAPHREAMIAPEPLATLTDPVASPPPLLSLDVDPRDRLLLFDIADDPTYAAMEKSRGSTMSATGAACWCCSRVMTGPWTSTGDRGCAWTAGRWRSAGAWARGARPPSIRPCSRWGRRVSASTSD